MRERVWEPQPRIAKVMTLRKDEAPNLQYGTEFNVHPVRRDDGSVVLFLVGELDVTSMAQFERAVDAVLSSNPRELIFDLSRSQFVSAQGYATMGRCSDQLPIEIRSRTGLAARVLTVLGYERVDVVVVVAHVPLVALPG